MMLYLCFEIVTMCILCFFFLRNKKARQWSAKQMVVFLNMITCNGQGSQVCIVEPICR
jgi:hypothetical protein